MPASPLPGYTVLPVMTLTSSKRSNTSSCNGYYSGNDTTARAPQLLQNLLGGEVKLSVLPDFSYPPPSSFSNDSVLSYLSIPLQYGAEKQGQFLPSSVLLQSVALTPVVSRDDQYSVTPEMLKMSPCLRTAGSPCADDLGNYAMHVNQMELVWHGEFDRLFAQYYPHAWYLVPTFYPPSDRWRIFKDSAKVRFSCQECGHGWTSMKGRVIFWFHLNYSSNSGYVMFKLYGQQCQKCKNGSYEHAMWYPEEVVKVIGNVYNRVGQIFYGFVRPPLRIDRRQGKPRNQHNADLCQACKEGLCKEEWSFS